jgi:outer membrane protein insertion porin family
MRQDVGKSWMDSEDARRIDLRCARWWLLPGLLLTCIGCQLTQPLPTTGVPSNLGRGLSSSYKPPVGVGAASAVDNASAPEDSSEKGRATNPSTTASASARIRGQSPTQWNASAPGSNAYRSPMTATDAGTAIDASNRNSYPTPTYVTTPGTPNSPPASYVSPQQYGAVGVPANQTRPGVAPVANGALPPNTVYQNPLDQTPSTNYGIAPAGQYSAPGYGAPGYSAPSYGYATPGAYPGATSPSDYGGSIAPGATQPQGSFESTVAPGAFPAYDPSGVPYPDITAPGGNSYRPRQRVSPIDVYVQEARTGRIILGGSVNSDLGVAGQLVIDERNFDIRNIPGSWNDLWSGRAFRGGGQNFRAEFMPGNQVQRYTVNWTEPNLFGYLPYSLSVGGFYYTRQYRDWTEQRLGGRAALGYAVTKDLSISSELRLEDVNISNPRVAGVGELDSALGSNDIYTARFRVARDTRDSPFMSTEGALLELIFDQVFGEYDYSRGNLNYSRYFMVRERPDGGGRHTIASTWKLGVTGSQTPIFENYFAGGYSTLRGFSFRGASPKVSDVQVGGELMFLGSLEYVFPLTADEMLRGVAFVDYGTVERDLKINSENFRVSPGLGLRVTVPALGPAPLAFDFAYPVNHAPGDDTQVFSFFMGFTR